WTLIGIALLIAAVAIHDDWQRVGRVVPGFALMENGQVGVGGLARSGLPPLAVILAVNGQPVSGARDGPAGVARHPAGTPLTYTLKLGDRRVEGVVPTRVETVRGFARSLVDGVLPALLVIGLAALVLLLRPGTPESRLFLAFSLVVAITSLTYGD